MTQKEVRIEVPQRATMNESHQLVELCNRAENEDGEVLFDCRATIRFGPFGVAALGSAIAIRRKAGKKSRIALPVDADAARFVSEVGLDKFAEGATTGIGTLEVRQMTALDAVYTGIPAALRRSRVRDLHRAPDADVIEAAVTMPLLTSRVTQVGGLGLKNIREVVALRGGRLTVLSLTAKVTWSGDKIHRAASPGFHGTAVEIDFRPNAPVERPSDYVSVF